MLSIIIPTLNEEKYLPLLLSSIRRQNFNDYEIIVADAGSEDKTLEIAKKHGCKIVAGGLPARARNNGAKVAKGDILLFLDADIVLSRSFLKYSVQRFMKRKLGIAGFLIKPRGGKRVDKFMHKAFSKWMDITKGEFHYAVMAIMSRKEIHNSIKGFDEGIKYGEDMSYVRSASEISKYGYIKSPFFTSLRRYEKDGRFTYVKNVLGVCHIYMFGPIRSNIFNYKFNHYRQTSKQ